MKALKEFINTLEEKERASSSLREELAGIMDEVGSLREFYQAQSCLNAYMEAYKPLLSFEATHPRNEDWAEGWMVQVKDSFDRVIFQDHAETAQIALESFAAWAEDYAPERSED